MPSMEDLKKMESHKEEFKKADLKFDEVMKKDREQALKGVKSNVELRKKTFMKISDVDLEDAKRFKEFCDRHTDKKQFLGIKVLMAIVDKLEPITSNLLAQISSLTFRVDRLEAEVAILKQPQVEEEPKLIIPQTQGKRKVR